MSISNIHQIFVEQMFVNLTSLFYRKNKTKQKTNNKRVKKAFG